MTFVQLLHEHELLGFIAFSLACFTLHDIVQCVARAVRGGRS